MAQTALENQDPAQAVDFLLQGLEINPTVDQPLRFLLSIIAKKLLPEEKKSAVAQALKKAKEVRAAVPQAEIELPAKTGEE